MRKIELLLIIIPFCFTLLVGWFSWSAFHAAPQVAAENLRGAALSSASAIEQLADIDEHCKSLSRYTNPDIAYFSLLDKNGVISFHTNPLLIGTVSNELSETSDAATGIYEGRRKLGTGEEVYLLQTNIHAAGSNYFLSLALHTFRAEQVIRRAQTGVIVVTMLTVSLWIITIGLMFLLRRDERRKSELARKEELARLGELGAVMAHEIRNPLAGIKGFAQLVETAETIESARVFAERIVTQSVRMESLVNDLLSFAREERGEKKLVDLQELLNDSVMIVRSEAELQNIEVIYRQDGAVSSMIVYDRVLQLILNLLKNGIQSMPEGGELEIELERVQSLAVIRVIDSGAGIPPENITHIFEPFWTDRARGTGLGLALCRKVALEHGGTLSVDSTVGVGTTFTLKLPLEN
ncbi:MAG: ATP-binding protein [Desulfuromonadaceae bacterium]|nr:ATP-binding protein [Desulfuromonadaceae bacterium]MDD2854848.1 ATP-binding protein [Desulfuromonadaceae bacterium]